RESGIGKGNFYYHFRSKEELGYAILEQIVSTFVGQTLEPCFSDPTDPPLAQIGCFLDRVVQAQRDRQCRGGCAMGTLASELSDVHEGFRKRLASVFTTWHARLAEALTEAKRRGHVGVACDPEASARFLVASLEGAILLTKLSKDIGVMEQCVGELKRYLTASEVRTCPCHPSRVSTSTPISSRRCAARMPTPPSISSSASAIACTGSRCASRAATKTRRRRRRTRSGRPLERSTRSRASP